MPGKDVVMKLKIPVLWHTEEAAQKEDIGIDVPTSEAADRVVIFYTIDSIVYYYDEGIEYTKFYSCGVPYLTRILVDELEKMIDKAREKDK